MHDGLIDGAGHQTLIAQFLMVSRLSKLRLIDRLAVHAAEAARVIMRGASSVASILIQLRSYLCEQCLHVALRILVKID